MTAISVGIRIINTHFRGRDFFEGTHLKNSARRTRACIPGNEIADGLAKQAAREPDGHGAGWLKYLPGPPGPPEAQGVRKEVAGSAVLVRAETLNKGYVLRKKGKPDPAPAKAEKRTASRCCLLKSGHALTGVYLKSTDNRPDDHFWWCDPENSPDERPLIQVLLRVENPACRAVGEGQKGDQAGEAEVERRRPAGG